MKYTVKAGRLICRGGVPFFTVQAPVTAAEYVSPTDLDKVTRDLAALLNARSTYRLEGGE